MYIYIYILYIRPGAGIAGLTSAGELRRRGWEAPKKYVYIYIYICYYYYIIISSIIIIYIYIYIYILFIYVYI